MKLYKCLTTILTITVFLGIIVCSEADARRSREPIDPDGNKLGPAISGQLLSVE